MKGKYLITTDSWFVAPDGKQYKAAWGDVQIMEDNALGVKTNRNSTNWYARIGTDTNHVIIAGCQIHYAVACSERPVDTDVDDWDVSAGAKNRVFQRPCMIAFFD
jgi:hypothetical protein